MMEIDTVADAIFCIDENCIRLIFYSKPHQCECQAKVITIQFKR